MCPVCLVHRKHIGEFEHAFLDALQRIAGTGEHENEEAIGHVGHGRLRLSHPDGLD